MPDKTLEELKAEKKAAYAARDATKAAYKATRLAANAAADAAESAYDDACNASHAYFAADAAYLKALKAQEKTDA